MALTASTNLFAEILQLRGLIGYAHGLQVARFLNGWMSEPMGPVLHRSFWTAPFI